MEKRETIKHAWEGTTMETTDERGLTHVDDCDGIDCTPDEPVCVDDGGHSWTRRGTGGCDENPGVWSCGGTTYTFARRCLLCGAREYETHYGSQRNPGRCDELEYEEDYYPVDEDEARTERRRLRRNRAARRRRYLQRVARAQTE